MRGARRRPRSIARIVDSSLFDEFKARYGTTPSPALPGSTGFSSASVANNGVLFSSRRSRRRTSSSSATSAHSDCVPAERPGFMVGRQVERGGLPKTGRRWERRREFGRAEFTVMTGGSFGAGNYAMSGRATIRVPLDVAERAHLCDGRRNCRGRLSTVKRNRWRARKDAGCAGEHASSAIIEKYESKGRRTTRPPAGTTVFSILHRHVPRSLCSVDCVQRAVPAPKFGVFRM